MAVVLADGLAPGVALTHARIGWATIGTDSNLLLWTVATLVIPLFWPPWPWGCALALLEFVRRLRSATS